MFCDIAAAVLEMSSTLLFVACATFAHVRVALFAVFMSPVSATYADAASRISAFDLPVISLAVRTEAPNASILAGVSFARIWRRVSFSSNENADCAASSRYPTPFDTPADSRFPPATPIASPSGPPKFFFFPFCLRATFALTPSAKLSICEPISRSCAANPALFAWISTSATGLPMAVLYSSGRSKSGFTEWPGPRDVCPWIPRSPVAMK